MYARDGIYCRRTKVLDAMCVSVSAARSVMYARDGHRGYFAVHDGHGGSEAAQYLAEHLYEDMITAIDEKLRSNKRFKSTPDDPIKRTKTETNIKAPSSSSLASSSGSEKSEYVPCTLLTMDFMCYVVLSRRRFWFVHLAARCEYCDCGDTWSFDR